MEELLELKELLLQGAVQDAILLAEDLEEMGRKGLERNIRSYAKVLLLHFIKQQVEQRSTKSWDVSIRNAVAEIIDINTRPKGKGFYLNDLELRSCLDSAFESALEQASLEALEGTVGTVELKRKVSKEELINHAFSLIRSTGNG